MLVQLSEQNILDYINADRNAGRKFSLGSKTDMQKPANVPSFSNKSVELQGSPYDVQKNGIGYACKKGLKPEAPNQDSFLILKVGDDFCLYGVFDGHGRKGHDVSNFVKDHFPKILFSQDDFKEKPDVAIGKTFKKLQYLIEKATFMKQIDASRSGTTVSIVLHDLQRNVLHIAHVGDSRVVLAKEKRLADGAFSVNSKDLTLDHKPDLPEERKRIEQAGGVVVFDGAWNHRVYAKKKDKTGRSYPGLNMSRAMGDLQGYHDAGISATPDIAHRTIHESGSSKNDHMDDAAAGAYEPSLSSYELDSTDKFLLLCSDGVWEFVSSSTAVQIANSYPLQEAQRAAEQLATIAWDHWVDEMNGEVVDDITALVVHLKGRPKPNKPAAETKAELQAVPESQPTQINTDSAFQPLPDPDIERPLIGLEKRRVPWKASVGNQ